VRVYAIVAAHPVLFVVKMPSSRILKSSLSWFQLLVVTIVGLSSRSSTTALSILPPLSSRQLPRTVFGFEQLARRNRSFPLSASFSRTVLLQQLSSQTPPVSTSSDKDAASSTPSKPRFVIEKLGGRGGRSGASSHASYYYGDYINDKVYREISNLCVQNFFGNSKNEIEQNVQSSNQKMELYKSLQPEELRRRRDDVKTASEFFVAYELREATPDDMDEYHRVLEVEQQEERRRMNGHATRKQHQVHYNSHNNNYYRVDHQIKSPAKMATGYEPYNQRNNDEFPVVMGGAMGGVAERRQARQQAKAAAQRPTKRYRQNLSQQHQQRNQQQQQASVNDWNRHVARNAVQSNQGVLNNPRSSVNDRGEFESHDPFYNSYTQEEVEQPLVMGGILGSVGPSSRTSRRMGRRVGPLFAHRRYQQYRNEFDYYQRPQSAQRSPSNNEKWGIEQPFMVEHQYNYNGEATRQNRPHQLHETQPPMPHDVAHTYSSSDEINFEYHYNPNVQQKAVQEYGLPLDDNYQDLRHSGAYEQRQEGFYNDPMTSGYANHHSHSQTSGDVFEKDAPMYVKGPMVGFVEIVHTPYSLGILDDPDMLTAGMKPHRPVLRNLVVAKHVRNSGIGTRLLEACERHVQTHWQMTELVVEVDDLWGEGRDVVVSLDGGKPSSMPEALGETATGAVEFYIRQGYEVVFSDPESMRYDEDTGEVLGQIQCRRDVMRKLFDNGDNTPCEGVSSHTKAAESSKSVPSKSKISPDMTESALDVEYVASVSEERIHVKTVDDDRNDFMSSTSEAAVEVELITDPSEGPKSSAGKSGSPTTPISCDPEGPNKSIFNPSNTFE
jgi:ribosomal protein S18 acetylase RimI-like enzyme